MQNDNNNMIVVTSTPRSPCGVNSNDNDANGVITTPTRTIKPNSPLKKSRTPPVLSPTSSSSPCPATPPLTPKRRAIFNSFWEKSSSSIREDDASSECSGRDVTTVKQSPKLQPSYLGVYNFAPPSPMITSKPTVVSATASPGSSSDSLHNLTLSPSTPKSILRRKNSLRERRVATLEGGPMARRDRSASLQLPFVPFTDDASLESKSTSDSNSNSKSSRQHSNNSNGVHFDPTITVREVIDSSSNSNNPEDSRWFSDSELGFFMQEAVHLCHSSAINAIKSYSLPSVAKAYAAAHEAGIKEPVVSTTLPQYRALFADPVLHATEDDAIVHDGSKKFFKIMSKEVARVLIVDSSPVTLKLFRRHVCSMFPHVRVDMAKSGEEALDFLNLDSDDGDGGGSKVAHVYDIIIAEEHLDLLSNECNDDGEQQSEHKEQEANDVDNKILHKYQSSDLLGSELLHLINDMELASAAAAARSAKSTSREPNQDREQRHDKEECAATSATKSSRSRHSPSRYSSLKIGVSSTLGEDCESLRKGGADLFWGKPPPKPSNGLRNQMLNALLSKRGKSIFICGC